MANPFDGERLQDATSARADMARVHFDGVNLSDVDVRDADDEGVRIEGVLVTDLLEARGEA